MQSPHIRFIPVFLVMALPHPVLADAPAQAEITLRHVGSANYHLSDGVDADAMQVKLAASWNINRTWLARFGAQWIDANIAPADGGGQIEELRLFGGAAWRNSINDYVTTRASADLIVAEQRGTIANPDETCTLPVTCPPRIRFTDFDAGAEVSAGVHLRAGYYGELFASGGYQVIGDDDGPVFRAGLGLTPTDDAGLQFLYFDEPRISGFEIGLRFRFR